MNKQNGIIASLIGGTIIAVVGYLVATYIGKPILVEARASESWPEVDGKVTSSKVVKSRGSEGKFMYEAVIEYSYTVEGQKHASTKLSSLDGVKSSSPSSAKKKTREYPVGKSVTVFYDPEVPENAMLEPGVSWKSYIIYGVGMLFVVFGILIFIGPLIYIVVAPLIVAGAATGLIGKSRDHTMTDNQFDDADKDNNYGRSASEDDDDDGFGL